MMETKCLTSIHIETQMFLKTLRYFYIWSITLCVRIVTITTALEFFALGEMAVKNPGDDDILEQASQFPDMNLKISWKKPCRLPMHTSAAWR